MEAPPAKKLLQESASPRSASPTRKFPASYFFNLARTSVFFSLWQHDFIRLSELKSSTLYSYRRQFLYNGV